MSQGLSFYVKEMAFGGPNVGIAKLAQKSARNQYGWRSVTEGECNRIRCREGKESEQCRRWRS